MEFSFAETDKTIENKQNAARFRPKTGSTMAATLAVSKQQITRVFEYSLLDVQESVTLLQNICYPTFLCSLLDYNVFITWLASTRYLILKYLLLKSSLLDTGVFVA